MKAVKGFIGIIIALSFIMGVYCAGTTKTYDFKTHLESFATVAQELPHIEDLGSIWTADIIENGLMTSGPGGQVRKTVHITSWPRNGVFKAATGESGEIWYPFNRSAIVGGSSDALKYLEPLSDFYDGVVEVCGRTFYTFVWIGDYIGGFFNLVWKVLPFSGLVERSA